MTARKFLKRLYFHNFPEYSELFSFDLAQLKSNFPIHIAKKEKRKQKINFNQVMLFTGTVLCSYLQIVFELESDAVWD